MIYTHPRVNHQWYCPETIELEAWTYFCRGCWRLLRLERDMMQNRIKEYWLNVYKADLFEQIYGWQQVFYVKSSRECAILEGTKGLLYRIHVKIDGGYNKRQMAHLKPFYKNIINKDAMDKKFNWMG